MAVQIKDKSVLKAELVMAYLITFSLILRCVCFMLIILDLGINCMLELVYKKNYQ